MNWKRWLEATIGGGWLGYVDHDMHTVVECLEFLSFSSRIFVVFGIWGVPANVLVNVKSRVKMCIFFHDAKYIERERERFAYLHRSPGNLLA